MCIRRFFCIIVLAYLCSAPYIVIAGGTGEKTEKKVSEGPVEISYFQLLGPRAATVMKSYSDMYQYQFIEQKFNVKFKFLHPPQGLEQEQFNLMIASKQLPDIISWDWTEVPGGPGKLIREGIILKLNDIFNKYAPNISKVLTANPEARRQCILDDGTFYMFPMLRLSENVRVNGGPAIRQDWLDRLGLKRPETIDEWYTVLKAFKEKDANGNGDPNDEIPIVSEGDQFLRMIFVVGWRVTNNFFIKKDGTIGWGPIEPEYKDFLSTMAKWYKEGLIDPDYITTDVKNFDAKVTSNRGGVFFAWMNGRLGRFNTLMRKNNPSFDLRATLWPKTKEGISYTANPAMAWMTEGPGAAITTANKKVELTAKILDYGYSDEGILLFNFGKLGESYVIENGKIKFTDTILKNPKGLAATNALTMYNIGSAGTGGPFIQDERYATLLREAVPQMLEAEKVWAQSKLGVITPPLQPAEADSIRLSRILNEVNTYVSEMSNKIIMGIEPLSKFDEFVMIQKRMNIEEAIRIQQKAYEGYLGRK